MQKSKMSSTLLYGIIIFLFLSTLYLSWRGYVLTNRIHSLTNALRRAADFSDQVELPEDTVELSALFSAIALFNRRFQRQMEQAKSERSRLAAVLEQIPDGVMIVDSNNRIEFANPAAHQLLESEELIGRSVAQALRYHQLVETWQRCIENGTMQSEVLEMPLQRGFLQLVAAPDEYAPGSSLLLVQDLTRLRRLETVRRDFISNLSHELRTPLASLKALTETLQAGALNDPPAAERFLKRIETEVDALTQMAQELLDLSRIESGEIGLNLQKVNPLELLEGALTRMKMQAERADVNLRLDCPDGLPPVQADMARVEQVLVNLIHNGIKFTSAGGTVTLSAQTGSRLIHFAVQDTGVGIPLQDLSRIFERFYKTDRARATRGTGLGLSISKHLIESHGGEIWAESVEGQGSTFYFSLPIFEEDR